MPWWIPVAVVVAGTLAYANGLSGPFVFDDIDSIPKNPHIRQLWPPSESLAAPVRTTVAGRPIVCLSLAWNYAIGGLDVRGYHVFNLALHLASALVLLDIVRRTLLAPTFGGRFERTAPWLAALTAVIWALHPLQTEAVTYVIQRTELLVGLFYLLTLYCAIRGRESSRQGLWYGASVVCCALGMCSKEVMVSAPLVVLLYDWTFSTRSWKETLQRHAGLHGSLAASWLVLLALLLSGARSASVGLNLQIPPLEYLATQAGVILWYLRLCFWPDPLVISYADWPVARQVIQYLPQGLIILALLAGTLWAGWRRRALGFLGAWFFLILAPTSSIVPIVTEIAAERRMYLPLAAVVVLVVVGGYRVLQIVFARRLLPLASRAGAGLAVVVAGILGYATATRNRDYGSVYAIWADTVAKRPGIGFAQFELGNALAAQGRLDEAMTHYQESLRIDPAQPEAHNNLANILADRGRLDEAIGHYEEALHLKPEWAETHNNLGTVLAGQRRLDEAARHYAEALRLKPSFGEAHSNFGVALAQLGRSAEAIAHFREAIKAVPNLAQPHVNLGDALAALGGMDEAIEEYREALRLDPTHAAARRKLEAALAKRRAGGTP